ncbi:hypothetical protein E3E26_02420 [Thermococcus sp. LS1]|uniref:hypothetical protein n=1 Tax=Thermococcus sp. LS1 TaxID=1638259 RepID=UPI0014391ADA|nr:hypothetical protein [Thermococcus sp. LS1]NJD98653.1 hypothetical protein [Thermococcus sp. LS1]
MTVSLEGFSSFLLIVIAPFLLLSLAVLVGNKDVIYRSPEGITKIYTWVIILPGYYLPLVFTFHVMLRYPLIGAIIFTVLTVGVLYITGNLKGDPLKVRRFSKHDYMLAGILATVYILIPAFITLLKKEFSIGSAIYFAIAILYFGYSFKLLREIHRSQKTRGAQKRCNG